MSYASIFLPGVTSPVESAALNDIDFLKMSYQTMLFLVNKVLGGIDDVRSYEDIQKLTGKSELELTYNLMPGHGKIIDTFALYINNSGLELDLDFNDRDMEAYKKLKAFRIKDHRGKVTQLDEIVLNELAAHEKRVALIKQLNAVFGKDPVWSKAFCHELTEINQHYRKAVKRADWGGCGDDLGEYEKLICADFREMKLEFQQFKTLLCAPECPGFLKEPLIPAVSSSGAGACAGSGASGPA